MTQKPEDAKADLKRRLKTIEGHIRGVQRMVDEDAYCIDIIHQARAIQSAIDRFNSALLAQHLQSCVTTALRSSNERERQRALDELLSVFNTRAR